MNKKHLSWVMVAGALVVLTACGDTPVPASDCDKVVSHIQSVLKDKAPSKSKLNKQCMEATDKARGCAMAADKPMKILQCL